MVSYKTIKRVALLIILIVSIINVSIILQMDGTYSDFGLLNIMFAINIPMLIVILILFFVKGKEKSDDGLKWVK